MVCNESDIVFAFDETELVTDVLTQTLRDVSCPYEAEINVQITTSEGIRDYNREYRGIDNETDVLSFPAVDYDAPADFTIAEKFKNHYINPDTGELFLGDIMLCGQRVIAQAEEYGHSIKREFAFLIAHSVLHLLGYDHLTEEEEEEMFSLQEKILEELGITRDDEMPE